MVNHTHAEPGNTFHESRTAQVGIIGRVGKDHLRLGAVHEAGVGLGVGRVAADQAVLADGPDVAELRDRRAVPELGGLVGRVRFLAGVQLADQDVDLRGSRNR